MRGRNGIVNRSTIGQLLEIVESLAGRGIGFRSLTEAIAATNTGGRLVFTEGRSFGSGTS